MKKFVRAHLSARREHGGRSPLQEVSASPCYAPLARRALCHCFCFSIVESALQRPFASLSICYSFSGMYTYMCCAWTRPSSRASMCLCHNQQQTSLGLHRSFPPRSACRRACANELRDRWWRCHSQRRRGVHNVCALCVYMHTNEAECHCRPQSAHMYVLCVILLHPHTL
jgi:hypothetical protein